MANRPRGASVDRRIRDTGNLLGTQCMSCHTQTDARSMHTSPNVRLGCTDCHGGDPTAQRDKDASHAAAKGFVGRIAREGYRNARLDVVGASDEVLGISVPISGIF